MILDKCLCALGFAGFFYMTAAFTGSASAAQVYPGCAEPGPSPTGKVWWIDPVNGKTPADGGNGSQTAPWNSLTGVIMDFFPPGYGRPLLSSVPYIHFVGGKRVYVADQLGDPPVHPGDTIKLMGGNYGDIAIGDYAHQVANPSFVTVEAAPGQTPVFSTLYIRSTNKWVFDGITVQSVVGTNGRKLLALVTVADQGAALPTSDIVLTNLKISSADYGTAATWSQADWVAHARQVGIFAWGSAGNGTNGEPNTTCVSMVGNHIFNVRQGNLIMVNNSQIVSTELDHFGDDGFDYGANNIAIVKNYIHDNIDLADGNHEDAMQGQNGPLLRGVPYNSFSNVLIDSNLVIRQADPKLAFPTYLQGIDSFDEEWTNLTVTNNVVVTSACWGIAYSSLHNGKIINNTVVADGLMPMPGTCKPIVAISDKSHEGPSSSDDIIRNNIANSLAIYNLDPNMTLDHNICLGIDGKCQIVTYLNGKPNWGVYKPGMYGDHNIIDGRGAKGMFADFEPGKFVSVRAGAPAMGASNSAETTPTNFDPAKFPYDLRLKFGAPAIGAGNSADAPSVDMTGAPRRSPIDVGAYQYSPPK